MRVLLRFPQRFCPSCCFEASTSADAPSSTLFSLPELTAVYFRKNSKAICWLPRRRSGEAETETGTLFRTAPPSR